MLDDTNNLRRLRDRFRQVAQRHGYGTRVIYLDIPLREIQRRMQRNEETEARHPVAPHLFAELVRGFEPPTPDEHVLIFRQGDTAEDWVKAHLPSTSGEQE